MSPRSRALPTPLIAGALVVTSVALIALVVVRPSIGANGPVRQIAGATDPLPAPDAGAATTTSSAPSIARPLEAHVWMPASVRIGSDRQLRVQVWDGASPGEQRQAEHLHVSFASQDSRFTVRPPVRVLTRGELPDARFAIAARADLHCGHESTGTLAVTVTSLLDPDRTTTTQVELPPLDCRAAPPEAPASVHVTEAVCGSDHADQVERLLEGETLDPRRCATHRWRDGEPRPWPPPRPAPRAAPPPSPPAVDLGDDADEGDEAVEAVEAEESDDPADAPTDADAESPGDTTDAPTDAERPDDADAATQPPPDAGSPDAADATGATADDAEPSERASDADRRSNDPPETATSGDDAGPS